MNNREFKFEVQLVQLRFTLKALGHWSLISQVESINNHLLHFQVESTNEKCQMENLFFCAFADLN